MGGRGERTDGEGRRAGWEGEGDGLREHLTLRVEVGALLDQKLGNFEVAEVSRIVQRSITILREAR